MKNEAELSIQKTNKRYSLDTPLLYRRRKTRKTIFFPFSPFENFILELPCKTLSFVFDTQTTNPAGQF
jgi:hypothetical protein